MGHNVHCPPNHRCTAVNHRKLVGRKMKPRMGQSDVSNRPLNHVVKKVQHRDDETRRGEREDDEQARHRFE